MEKTRNRFFHQAGAEALTRQFIIDLLQSRPRAKTPASSLFGLEIGNGSVPYEQAVLMGWTVATSVHERKSGEVEPGVDAAAIDIASFGFTRIGRPSLVNRRTR